MRSPNRAPTRMRQAVQRLQGEISPFFKSFRDYLSEIYSSNTLPGQTSGPRKDRLSIMDIPDRVLKRILQFHCSETHRQGDIRLVNKRLSTVALEVVLHTISVKTPDDLLRLTSAPLSPLYLERLGKFVHCFELGFFKQDHQLVGIHYDIPLALPNLDAVRFRFTLGVPIDAGATMRALLSEDTMCRAMRTASDCSWLRFLSQFNPRKFEWISDEPQKLYLVGVYTELRLLLEQSWSSLTSISLEGICFVEQRDLDTWTPAFLAERVHIRGVPIANTSFLRGLSNIRDSNRCHYLLLEAMKAEEGSQVLLQESKIPIVAFGHMLVAIRGWNTDTRRKFVANLTEKLQPLVNSTRELKSPKQRWANLGSVILIGLRLLAIFASILLVTVIRYWHAPAPHGKNLYPEFAHHLKSSHAANNYRYHDLFHEDISFHTRLLGLSLPPFGQIWRSSTAVGSFDFVPT
ncbi:hypothetical protein HYPSUDRAFT_627337 [Hypholoma sublateritium FD-334 SS-4]|uniref:Uncharacterized protein n=1 Tax=Hypholoma sublateritium (strain FD-334 SS-4) TaxID=945553 RepID=A0A0D2PDH8_HYPSF|nr:hypothetical protein HYPSUDRAFT_627337 [Hypholoma sublateritium FD-334 SS-4]